jgi:phosphate starvation-inducible protein PhoH
MDAFKQAIHDQVKRDLEEYNKSIDETKKPIAVFGNEADRLTYLEQPLGVPIALERLCVEFRKDQRPGSLYETWQANIAAAFYDAVKKYCEEKRVRFDLTDSNITMQIANAAATNFLNNLCSQKPKQ